MSSGCHPVAQQLEHRGADELGLGALAAGLEQADGAVRRDARRGRLEQRALEVVEGAAGARCVVLGAGLERDVLAGERLEQLDRRRAARQRGAAGLVGERDADVGLRVAHEGLHEVELGRQQLVEAVQEQRAPGPDVAHRVQRGVGEPVRVDGAERLEPAVVGRIQRGELAGVRRRRAGLAPGADRGAEPRRAGERALQLGEQVPQGGRRSPGRRTRPRARAARRRGSRRAPRARARAGRAAARARRPCARGHASDAGTSSPRRRTRARRRRARGRSGSRPPTWARPARGRAAARRGGARARRPPWPRWPDR